jgi:hypothetical protein
MPVKKERKESIKVKQARKDISREAPKETPNNAPPDALPVNGLSYFMNDLFSNYLTTKTHIDTKINWLLGVSGLLMSLFAPLLFNESMLKARFGVLIILLFSFLSFIICLLALDAPAIFGSKKTHDGENNYMFYKDFKGKSVEEIHAALNKIKTTDDVLRLYSINLHNLIEHNIAYKKNFFILARNTLLAGAIIGLVFIIGAMV